jgi:hypothetical protein
LKRINYPLRFYVFSFNFYDMHCLIQVTHHHSPYSAAHPTHPGHGLVGSLVGAASRGYPTPAGGPVAALHHTHAPPPPVHTTDYTAHHQLSQQVNKIGRKTTLTITTTLHN